MDLFFALAGFFLFFTAVILPWLALVRAGEARRIAERALELAQRREARQPAAVTSTAGPIEAAPPAHTAPPPLPESKPEPRRPVPIAAPEPPPLPPQGKPASAPAAMTPAFNWEQFMGAKLLNWAGGFTLFLGLAFALKYSLDNNLIPPAIRATVGFITGLGLVIGGLSLNRERYAVTTHTLCATGIVTLYAVTFACRALWHFEHFETTTAFAIMGLITAAAFTLAVRLEARVVAVLGIAGGFLTPVLISTGQDNMIGLFGYIALLNTGLLAVALRQRWNFLAGLGAAGTALLSLAWMDRHYDAGHYSLLPATCLPMAAILLQQALYALACRRAAIRDGDAGLPLGASALGTAALACIFGIRYLFDARHDGAEVAAIANTPAVAFSYLLLIEAGVIMLGTRVRALAWAGPACGGLIAGLMGLWMTERLTETNLGVALGMITAFAVLHTALPAVLRRMGRLAAPPAWTNVVAPAALALTLIPIFKFETAPALAWPVLFALDLLAVAIAAMTLVLWPVVVALALTLLGIGVDLLDRTAPTPGFHGMLLMLAAFSLAFVAAGLVLRRRVTAANPQDEATAQTAAMMPALAATLPFLLLIVAVSHLRLADPSAPFGVALLLSLMLLGLADKLKVHALAPVGLAGVTLLQLIWQEKSFSPANATIPLLWHLGFAALYLAYPLVRHRRFESDTAPWIAAALALPAHFLPVYRTVTSAWPTDYPGYIPALFALPALGALAAVLKRTPHDSPSRLTQTALLGGVSLLFITLIFPIQFENEWLTLAWALEGAALIRLHRRIPHGGLVAVGLALLAAVFVRLTLNEAVLSYHPRADRPIFNTYLYTYGVAAACMAVAASALPEKFARAGGVAVRAALGAAVAILAFLLLNLEIADYFTPAGASTTALAFHGNFTRDMTYSIAWGLFAIVLLVVGIAKGLRGARHAAIGLVLITLGKLFLHDLTQLDKPHRIGAFIGVAAIMLIVSALYQKFRAGERA